MGIRSILAMIVAAALLAVGAHNIDRASTAGLGDFLATLLYQAPMQSLFCTIVAWGSVLTGLFAVFAARAAFGAHDDDDDLEYRQSFPKTAVLILLAASLGLFWLAMRCSGQFEVIVVEPPAEPASSLEDELLGTDDTQITDQLASQTLDEPMPVFSEPGAVFNEAGADEIPGISLAAPEVMHLGPRAEWPFKYPLVREAGYVGSASMNAVLNELFPMDDGDGAVRAMLCGKAWVAFTGASSEEGPRARNLERSRYRAEIAAKRANKWLDAHSDNCARPVVLAVDLGQHVDTLAPDGGNGETTGRQRETLSVAREPAPGGAGVSDASAAAEMRAYLADPVSRRALLGARTYDATPVVFVSSGAR